MRGMGTISEVGLVVVATAAGLVVAITAGYLGINKHNQTRRAAVTAAMMQTIQLYCT